MINFWAVLVAAIAAMVIGSIWWGPLFGKMWMKENGFDHMSDEQKAKAKKSMPAAYIQQLILSFIHAWVLAILINRTNASSIGAAVCLSLLVWVGFAFPEQYGKKLWGNSKWMMIFATLSGSLVTMVVMGLILGSWR